MRNLSRWLNVALCSSVCLAAMIAGCGGDDDAANTLNGGFNGVAGSATGGKSGASGSSGASASAGSNAGGTAGASGAGVVGGADSGSSGHSGTAGNAGSTQAFDVQPSALQTIAVQAGQTPPTVAYHATLDGSPISAGWSIDRGELGSITPTAATDAVFTPNGTAGGLLNVRAGLNGTVVTRQVLITLASTQNGPTTDPGQQSVIVTDVGQLTVGGGIGGVGGEGLGTTITDDGLLSALATPVDTGSGQSLSLIYPYDNTLWPRGMLAPLLQWRWADGDADAIKIRLSTRSGAFQWEGTFGRPAILAQTGGKFTRHPIPQDVWDQATNSAGGLAPDGQPDTLKVELTVAHNGQAHGPISETWNVAPARLTGTIYYNSYGTKLANNFSGAVGGDGRFGGAVLSIKVGDTAPKLAVGGDSPPGDDSGCRVCHSVAAFGSRLIAQHGDSYGTGSAFDLSSTGPAVDHVLPAQSNAFPAVFPDGSKSLTYNGLQSLPDGAPVANTGLSDVATGVLGPAFSPDGKKVAFQVAAGPQVTVPGAQLVAMNFDNATNVFSNPVTLVDDSADANLELRPGWPAFLPTGDALLFHNQLAAGADGLSASEGPHTRKGARAEVWWAHLSGQAPERLNRLNGRDASNNSYLPVGEGGQSVVCDGDGVPLGTTDADHPDDTTLNYEPTVLPIVAGGYAWVVFVSRRLYGNVATIPPFCSDPRGFDLVQHITTKKLWVAAIDLNAPAGSDASFPAFYLPAQEILAGNSRGFWVLDPCRSDGTTCETGDQCCGGYCQPNGEGGALVCSNTIPSNSCAGVQEHCDTAADCCDTTNVCINGFCAIDGGGIQ